ncbi:hypothetical protein [Microbulbifer sp. ANSA003]|uniref:hypothetical protein n=1 Tax=Microbulbifer sp. ANSA003 TaxID=3243360 RepID=UPI0040410D59
MSCSHWRPPVTEPPRPLPPGLMSPCPVPAPYPDNNADAVAIELKRLYDLYGTCAGRLFELQHWLSKSEEP